MAATARAARRSSQHPCLPLVQFIACANPDLFLATSGMQSGYSLPGGDEGKQVVEQPNPKAVSRLSELRNMRIGEAPLNPAP